MKPRASDRRPRASAPLHRLAPDAQTLVEPGQVELAPDHANRARECAGLGEHVVRRACQVVAPRRCQLSHGGHQRLLFANAGELTPEQIRRQRIATRAVDAQHHGPHPRIPAQALEQRAQRVRADAPRILAAADRALGEQIGHAAAARQQRLEAGAHARGVVGTGVHAAHLTRCLGRDRASQLAHALVEGVGIEAAVDETGLHGGAARVRPGVDQVTHGGLREPAAPGEGADQHLPAVLEQRLGLLALLGRHALAHQGLARGLVTPDAHDLGGARRGDRAARAGRRRLRAGPPGRRGRSRPGRCAMQRRPAAGTPHRACRRTPPPVRPGPPDARASVAATRCDSSPRAPRACAAARRRPPGRRGRGRGSGAPRAARAPAPRARRGRAISSRSSSMESSSQKPASGMRTAPRRSAREPLRARRRPISATPVMTCASSGPSGSRPS